MTMEENDVLGSMAGWRRCTRCDHFVEPWSYDCPTMGPDQVCGVIHPVCYMAGRSHDTPKAWAENSYCDTVLRACLDDTP
jgi:hypothetical protein